MRGMQGSLTLISAPLPYDMADRHAATDGALQMRFCCRLVAAAVAIVVAAPVALGYPDRIITLIVPYAAGGATDVVARIYADHMARSLGQQLVIENVAGAG